MLSTNRLLALAVLLISALTSALPTNLITKDTTPKTFTINGFTTFSPSAGNPNPKNINFSFSADGIPSTQTSCSASGALAADAVNLCSNDNTEFFWDGKALSVGLSLGPTAANATGGSWVFGDLTPSLYCYPITPPVPLGAGTLCQTPTGQVSGSLSRVTVDA